MTSLVISFPSPPKIMETNAPSLWTAYLWKRVCWINCCCMWCYVFLSKLMHTLLELRKHVRRNSTHCSYYIINTWICMPLIESTYWDSTRRLALDNNGNQTPCANPATWMMLKTENKIIQKCTCCNVSSSKRLVENWTLLVHDHGFLPKRSCTNFKRRTPQPTWRSLLTWN